MGKISTGYLRIVLISIIALWAISYRSDAASENDSKKSTAINAARGVIQRLIPKQAEAFVLETIPPNAEERNVFEIESRDGKIVLRGDNGVSLCSALNWYLKYYCHADISWNGVQLNLPAELPPVPQKIHRNSPHQYRYFFNYCCFGYSMPWWDWSQWEFMIDWMALNGVNAPLAVTGEEAVWQTVMREWGLSDEAICKFLAGPPYLPFGWMGCLDGWGGPLPQDWIDRHCDLQKKILARERELGMTPIVQGFTGHVPAAIQEKFPSAKLHKIQWIEWNTVFIDPLDPLFQNIGKTFVEKQNQMFGSDHLYAADTFIEMSPPSNDPEFLKNMGKSISDTLIAADPKAIWVMQGWIFYNNAQFWQPPQAKAFLDGVPDDRMILLDLFCDHSPVWKRTDAFYGKPWIWCSLQNFGNTVSLSGPLPFINEELHKAASDPERGKLSGIGMTQEGLDYNPVVFEFMTEQAWRDNAPLDLKQWIADYALRRYGKPSPAAKKAWAFLLDSVYNDTHSSNSRITTPPIYYYDDSKPMSVAPQPEGLINAWEQLLQCADEFKAVDAYRFDLINVTRQVLSNYAPDLFVEAILSYREKNLEGVRKASENFLALARDLDSALATRQEFLLGKWLEDAKRWGNNDEERRIYEWNARNVITLWGDSKSQLRDYARKEWSGMISGYYFDWWKMFFERLEASLVKRKPFDNDELIQARQIWGESWTRQTDSYPSQPSGDSVEVAIELHKKYGDKLHKIEAIKRERGRKQP